jgi:hypothetical protein
VPSNAEFFFCFHFCGKTMAIPSEATFDVPTTHCLIARHCVLYESGEEMPVVRKSVGKWWTVVEDEFVVSVCAHLAGSNAGSKGVVAFPTRKNSLFEAGKVRLGVNLRVRHAVRLEAMATLNT